MNIVNDNNDELDETGDIEEIDDNNPLYEFSAPVRLTRDELMGAILALGDEEATQFVIDLDFMAQSWDFTLALSNYFAEQRELHGEEILND